MLTLTSWLQVTGMLTVEFLFTSSSPAPAPAPAAEVARFSGVSHSEARTVVNKPLGIMKQPQPDPGAEAAARKTFSPYFEYNGQQLQPDLLKPPSRSSSMKRTAFAEPLERVEPSPAQLREIADCRVPATSTAINTAEGEVQHVINRIDAVVMDRCNWQQVVWAFIVILLLSSI